MTLCCRCNAEGKCRGCVCVKSKRLCNNCLPSRKSCCSNTKQCCIHPPCKHLTPLKHTTYPAHSQQSPRSAKCHSQQSCHYTTSLAPSPCCERFHSGICSCLLMPTSPALHYQPLMLMCLPALSLHPPLCLILPSCVVSLILHTK